MHLTSLVREDLFAQAVGIYGSTCTHRWNKLSPAETIISTLGLDSRGS
jgi:hypothetical protein